MFARNSVQLAASIFRFNSAVTSNPFGSGNLLLSMLVVFLSSTGVAIGGGATCYSVAQTNCDFSYNSAISASASGRALGGAIFAQGVFDTMGTMNQNTATSGAAPPLNIDGVTGQSLLPLAGAVAIGFGVGSGTTACVDGAAGVFSGSSFNSNSAALGGSIAVCGAGSSVEATGASFLNNTANAGGAVVVLNGASFSMPGGVMSNNSAMYGGAVALAGGSYCTLWSGLVAVGNAALYQGGVVYSSVTRAAVNIQSSVVFLHNRYVVFISRVNCFNLPISSGLCTAAAGYCFVHGWRIVSR